MSTSAAPASKRPMLFSGSPALRDRRNHSTSIGAPRFSTSSPACARTVERRPSAPMTRSARTSSSPSFTPEIFVSPRSPVTSAFIRSRNVGYRAPCCARKLRKSHCGIMAMNPQRVGRWRKSAILSGVSPNCAVISATRSCGSSRSASSRPSSAITSRVEGCSVSPRKSRRKSACFSSTSVSMPARASSSPSIMPAGPPPAMATFTWLTDGLDARLLQDAAHLAGELLVELAQLGGVLVGVLELVVGDVFLPRFGLAELLEYAFPIGDVLARNSRRRDHPAHLRHRCDIEPGFLERRHVRERREARLVDLREQAHVAGADVLAGLVGLDHHHVDVPAEQRRDPLAAAGEGDELPARAGGLLQLLAHHVVAAGDRAARLLELARLLFRSVHEVGQRLVGGVGLHRDDRRLEQQAGDRRQILQRYLGLVAGERVGEPYPGEDADGVRLALLLGEIRRGHHAATAGLVHDLGPHRQQLLLLHHVGHGAREHVAAAARSGMHHQLDRPGGGKALGKRRRRRQQHRAQQMLLHPSSSSYLSAFTRHALNLPNSGTSRISSANDSITAGTGLDSRIERLPSDIISDWRSARSIAPPSTSPRISGADGKSSLRIR